MYQKGSFKEEFFFADCSWIGQSYPGEIEEIQGDRLQNNEKGKIIISSLLDQGHYLHSITASPQIEGDVWKLSFL